MWWYQANISYVSLSFTLTYRSDQPITCSGLAAHPTSLPPFCMWWNKGIRHEVINLSSAYKQATSLVGRSLSIHLFCTYHTTTTVMSPSPSASFFSAIPPELICRVFEFANDFSEVASLARTAPLFYRTWRENATSICQAVAPRVFSDLTDAERLLDIQEEAEAMSTGQTQEKSKSESKSLLRAKRLLFNARCASAACDTWVDFCQIHNSYTMDRGEDKGLDTHMRPSEIARFKHAFYCVWSIGIMATTPHLQDQASAFLDDCSPPELCRLDEFGDWATSYNENDYGSLGLDLHDEVWKAGCDLVSKRWVPYLHGIPMARPDNTPVGFFAFFDETQWYLDLIQELYERERLSNPLFQKVGITTEAA